MGNLNFQFEMNRDGAERMKHLTDRYKQEPNTRPPTRDYLNDSLYSAPAISNKIESRGVITFEVSFRNRFAGSTEMSTTF